MTAATARFVALGRLTVSTENWEVEFVTPLMREALVRTVKDALKAQGAELECEVPSARWHKNGLLVNNTAIGAMPCWVWWVK